MEQLGEPGSRVMARSRRRGKRYEWKMLTGSSAPMSRPSTHPLLPRPLRLRGHRCAPHDAGGAPWAAVAVGLVHRRRLPAAPRTRQSHPIRDETGLVASTSTEWAPLPTYNDRDRADRHRRDRRPHCHGPRLRDPQAATRSLTQSVLITFERRLLQASHRFLPGHEGFPSPPAKLRRTARSRRLPPCCRSAGRRARRHLADEHDHLQGLGSK